MARLIPIYDLIVQFIKFVEDDSLIRNKWLEVPGFKIYVRKSSRIINQKRRSMVDIANVEVEEKSQNQGSFRTVLLCIEIAAQREGIEGIYIENVLTERFAQFFRKNSWNEMKRDVIGYDLYGGLEIPTSFYKMFS